MSHRKQLHESLNEQLFRIAIILFAINMYNNLFNRLIVTKNFSEPVSFYFSFFFSKKSSQCDRVWNAICVNKENILVQRFIMESECNYVENKINCNFTII